MATSKNTGKGLHVPHIKRRKIKITREQRIAGYITLGVMFLCISAVVVLHMKFSPDKQIAEAQRNLVCQNEQELIYLKLITDMSNDLLEGTTPKEDLLYSYLYIDPKGMEENLNQFEATQVLLHKYDWELIGTENNVLHYKYKHGHWKNPCD